MHTCFVCEAQFEHYDEMARHIRSTHESPRDYVQCPCCSAPVRDMKLHYRRMHPLVPMPNVEHVRCFIWHEPNAGGKKKAKPTWFQGNFYSAKNGRLMHHRSGLELALYQALEQVNSVTCYRVEPFAIPYLFDGSVHDYHPDLLVEFTDRRELWEVKPKSQTKQAKNIAKWDAAATYCQSTGMEFKVLTERGVGDMRVAAGLSRRMGR